MAPNNDAIRAAMAELEAQLPKNPELPEVRAEVCASLEALLAQLPPIPVPASLLATSAGYQREEYACLREALGRLLCSYFEHFCTVRNYCSVSYRVFSDLHCAQCISPDFLRQVFWSYQRGAVTDIDAVSYCAIVAAGSSLSSFDGISDDTGPESLGGADGPGGAGGLRAPQESIFDPINKYARQRRRMAHSVLPTIDAFKTEVSSSGLPLMSECYGILMAAELLRRASQLQVDPENELEFESTASRSMHLLSEMYNNAWARVSAMGVDLREMWAGEGASGAPERGSAGGSRYGPLQESQQLPHTPKLDKAMHFSIFSAEQHRSTPTFNETLTSIKVVNPTSGFDQTPDPLADSIPPRLREVSRLQATARSAEEALEALGTMRNSPNFTTSTRSLEPAHLFAESSAAERAEGRRAAEMEIQASLRPRTGSPASAARPRASDTGRASLIQCIRLVNDRAVLLILADVASRLFCEVRAYCTRVQERYELEVKLSQEAAQARQRQDAQRRANERVPYGVSTVASRAAAARGAALRAEQSQGKPRGKSPRQDLLTTAPEGKSVKPPSIRIRDPQSAQAQRALRMKALPLRDYVDNVRTTYMTALYSNLASWSSIRHLVFTLAYARAVLCGTLYGARTLNDAVYLLTAEVSIRKAFSESFLCRADRALFEFVVWMGGASVRKTTFEGSTPSTLNDAILSSRALVEDDLRSKQFHPGASGAGGATGAKGATGRARSGRRGARVSSAELGGATARGLLATSLPAQPNPMTEVDNLIIQLRMWALHLGSKLIYGGLDIGAVPYIHDPVEAIAFAHNNSLWGRFEPNEAAALLVVLWAFNTSIFASPEDGVSPVAAVPGGGDFEAVEGSVGSAALGASAVSAGGPAAEARSRPRSVPRNALQALTFCEVGVALAPMVRRASQHLQIALGTMTKDLYLYFSQPPGSLDKCEAVYYFGA